MSRKSRALPPSPFRRFHSSPEVIVHDVELGPVGIRAFGRYSFRIGNVAVFAVKLMGSLDRLTVTDVQPQLRAVIATTLAVGLGNSTTAFIDIGGDQAAMSQRLRGAVEPAFEDWGLTCTSLFVESVSLPEGVGDTLRRRVEPPIGKDIGTLHRAGPAEPGQQTTMDRDRSITILMPR